MLRSRVGGWVGEWVVGGWGVGRSNLILDPTLALIRAQLGFRIQVGAECGNKGKHTIKLISISLIIHY